MSSTPKVSAVCGPTSSIASPPNGTSKQRCVRSSVVFDDPLRLLHDLRQEGRMHDVLNQRSSDTSCVDSLRKNARGPSVGVGATSSSETICVAIRIRPRLPRDARGADAVEVAHDSRSIAITELAGNARGQKAAGTRAYDHVFDSRSDAKQSATQEHVYDMLGDRLVKGALSGYNGCLLAYGQTGTGKTHTVVGHMSNPEQRGLLPRILEGICAELERHSQDSHSRVLKISFIEIYNEMVRDLLLPSPQRAQAPALSVRYTPQVGLVIDGLSEAMVGTLSEARELVDFGLKMRSIAATSMNTRSSRSHTIFTFRLEQSHEDGVTKMAQVQIVDLAGREQQRTSGDDPARLRERSFINKSLFHLSTCIGSLSRNAGGRLPEWAFRNSKLTLVLMNSLGKNSRTAMVAAVSPGVQDVDETISTLRFASTVKLIKTEASCNMVDKRDLITELQQEIERLKVQQTDASADHALQQRVSELEALCDQYRESLEEAQVQSKLLAARRKEALEDLGLSVNTDCTSVSFIAQQIPYLVNLSDDPFIDGSLMYFLKNEKTTLGMANDNTMKIVGLGVASYHCEIIRHGSEGLSLHVSHSPSDFSRVEAHRLSSRRLGITNDCAVVPRTLVNGQCIDSSIKLGHQDHVVIGHTCAFRVMVPREERIDCCDEASSSETGSENDSHLVNRKRVTASFGARLAERYCQHAAIHDRNHFTQEANDAMALVDEANFITSQVFSEKALEFQLRVLGHCSSTPLCGGCPDLGVGLFARCKVGIEADGSSDRASNGAKSMLFIWSLPKFRSRVCAMQEIWEESEENGVLRVRQRLEQEPHLDPWREISEEEVQALLHGTQVAVSQGQSKKHKANDGNVHATRKRGSVTSTCTESESEADSSSTSQGSWATLSDEDADELADSSCNRGQNKWYHLGRRCSIDIIDPASKQGYNIQTARLAHPVLLGRVGEGVTQKVPLEGLPNACLEKCDFHLPQEWKKTHADICKQQQELAQGLAQWNQDLSLARTMVLERIQKKQATLNQLRNDVSQLLTLEKANSVGV